MSKREREDLGFWQRSRIEKVGGRGNKGRDRIFTVGNDSTQHACGIIVLPVDFAILMRQRLEFSCYWTHVPHYYQIVEPANQDVY